MEAWHRVVDGVRNDIGAAANVAEVNHSRTALPEEGVVACANAFQSRSADHLPGVVDSHCTALRVGGAGEHAKIRLRAAAIEKGVIEAAGGLRTTDHLAG